MPEMILPGVYIEVRPEGLIVPGQISVGTVGVVGTAAKGPVGVATLVGSYADAVRRFGGYDAWRGGTHDELTLVRALQLVFTHGATTVYAVRVAGGSSASASITLASATGNTAKLTARTPGEWANDLTVNVAGAEESPVIEKRFHGSDLPISLPLKPIQSARNRVQLTEDLTGISRALRVVSGAGAAAAGEARLDPTTGAMTVGDMLQPNDVLDVTFLADKSSAVKVTLRLGTAQEIYTVVDGNDLADDVNDAVAGSAWVTAAVAGMSHPEEPPAHTAPAGAFAPLKGGDNGAANADYRTGGLDPLLAVDVHIVVAAGQDEGFGGALAAHCEQASTDLVKRDRIAVVGSGIRNPSQLFDAVVGHPLDSERVVFVAPGIKAQDTAAAQTVVLPGAYAAAAVAGKLSALSPHVSLTNKPLLVDGLEAEFDAAQLTQLVKARVLGLERRQGFRVVKGITTSTGSAFAQITTRRIVDYAKYGVRSSATPYIGLLNNVRVRGAMHATLNTFLDGMVKDEMLTAYKLEVTATREDERQGIARVTLTLQPTFSIDYIRVTMFLE